MASAGGISSKRPSLKDIKSRLFECGLCHEQIVNRKEMPCGHKFCLKCFQENRKRGNTATDERCPNCNCMSKLPSDKGWKLRSPRGVSAIPTGGYVTVENVNGDIKKFRWVDDNFINESHFKANRKLESGNFSRPWDIAVDEDGVFFVTDCTSCINMYASDGKFMRKFFTTSPNMADDNDALFGITLNNHGQLVVGEVNGKHVRLLRTDGTLLRSFPVEVKPMFLAVTPKGDIVVSACEGTVAVIIDENGNKKCEILAPTMPTGVTSWCPTGVACSKKGELFVANRHGEVGIYKYTSEGEYVGLYTKNVITPWGLAVSDDDKFLFVSDERETNYFILR